MVLEWILGATVAVSLISLVGLLVLGLRENVQKIFLFYSVAFAAGTMLGAAFFDLLPESLKAIDAATALPVCLAGIMAFFIVEKYISWHHHHETHDNAGRKRRARQAEEKPMGYLNLVGDGLHNFFDGVAIAASFMVGLPLGITTTLVIALHEVPQEMGDFGLLLYSGFSRRKAIAFNLLTALTCVLGALLFYFAAPLVQNLEGLGLAFTAGGFIYIAGSDLFPEFHRETDFKKSVWQLLLIFAGIALIWLVVGRLGG